ncbi:MAG TPA: NUDIX domain-containing protein [Micropepsaceae bacterium]|nr:NUDIX domain-containing protein [Micropepsaceae bacterium]
MLRFAFALGHGLRKLWWRISRRRTLGVRVMLHRDRKLLVIRHRYGGPLMLPGGGVDRAETVLAAARRELTEETGILDCGPLQLAGVYLHVADGRPDYVVLFTGELPDVLPAYPATALSEVESVHIATADSSDETLSPATRRRIAEILDGAPISEWW